MQRDVRQQRKELVIKEENSKPEHYLQFLKCTGFYSEVAAGCIWSSCLNIKEYISRKIT
jgi:hypothetical protein